MFREVDVDPSGSLNFEQFVKVMAPKLKNKDGKEECKKTFDLFDLNGVGTISFLNLKKVAQEVGENLTDQELQDMIAEADRDGDAHVTFDEFFRVMSKKCNDPLNEFDSEEENEVPKKKTMVRGEF